MAPGATAAAGSMVKRAITVTGMLMGVSRDQVAKGQLLTEGHRYMLRSGFISQAFSGGYYLLPFGQRTLQKLTALIDEEMSLVGGVKISAPILALGSLWRTSGRWDSTGEELFSLKDRHETEFCLGPTHEELFTSLVAKEMISHRHLPLRLYQIDRKFRDEKRPRHGLLRAREFWMKDMYTFDDSVSTAMTTYEEICTAYESLFKRLSLPVTKVKAHQGTIGGSLSHEYHVINTDVSTDTINVCNKCGYAISSELLPEEAHSTNTNTDSMNCPHDDCQLSTVKGIEVAHSFFLGTQYSKMFEASFMDNQTHPRLCEMGCYGVGVSRLIQAIVEYNLTKYNGRMIWPLSIAPMRICVTPLGNKKDHEVMSKALSVYHQLSTHYPGDVILDDRNHLSIGERLRHIEQLGYPLAVIIGHKVSSDHVELHVQCTSDKTVDTVHTNRLIETIKAIHNDQNTCS